MSAKVLCIGDVMLDVVTKIAVMPSEINYGAIPPLRFQRMAAELLEMLPPGLPAPMPAPRLWGMSEMILPALPSSMNSMR